MNIRTTIAAGVASLLASLALRQISADPRLIPGIVITTLLLVLAGLAFRLRGEQVVAGALAQFAVLIVGLLISWDVVSRNLPGDRVDRWMAGVDVAQTHMYQSQAPMGPNDPTLIVLLAIVALVVVLVDLFAVTGRYLLPAWGVLLVPYLVAVVVLRSPVNPLSFLLVLVGWLLLGGVGTFNLDRLWTRAISPAEGSGLKRSTLAGVGALIAIPAAATALVAGLLAPPDAEPRWLPGGNRSGPIQLTDPTIRLDESLRRPDDTTLLTYRTSTDSGLYLRTTALVKVDGSGWGQADMSLQRGFPNTIPGLGAATATVSTEINIRNFQTNYLPVPYAPTSWNAEGRWSYDPITLTVLNTGREKVADTMGLTYTAQSTNVQPPYQALELAMAGKPSDEGVSAVVPDDVPQAIRNLATRLTADQTSDGLKAIALQNYLRNTDVFSYSLDAPPGNNYSVMMNFLFRTHSGYCIHFASAMALMARTIGIPSRVAIGFVPGTQQADGSWLVTSHDMHAWPELYFAGLGWVQFDPTISVADAPTYTVPPVDAATPSVSAEPSTTPTPSSQDSPTPSATAQPSVEASTQVQTQSRGLGFNPAWLLLPVLVAAVLGLPWFVRREIRGHRLHSPAGGALADAAWDETRANAVDLGVSWPNGTSRQVAAILAPGLDESGAAALTRLAVLREQSLFASWTPKTSEQVASDVLLVRSSWAQRATGKRRLLASLLPASLWRSGRKRVTRTSDMLR